LGFALSRKAYHFAGHCQQFIGGVRLLHEGDRIAEYPVRDDRPEGPNQALNRNYEYFE
jgi:hypothetical protein